MDHVGPAVFLPQPVVGGAYIEEKQTARATGIGYFEQHACRKIENSEQYTAVGKLHRCRYRILAVFEARRLERERLVEEFASRVVVFDCELRTGGAPQLCTCRRGSPV